MSKTTASSKTDPSITPKLTPEDLEALIPAVLYLRMSSDEQCASISQQRKELTAWARSAGYRIIGEYVDEGKSGSKEPEKREQFQRMLMDSHGKTFQAVLCWNTSRFSRLDSIDGGFAAKILRDNGIWLHTLRDGKIDWTTFQGRMLAALKAELDNQYSLNLSADSLRGRQDVTEAGFWAVGPIPYGYDKLHVDTQTGQQTLYRRTERVSKGRNVRVKLVINQEEAEVVRWIYRTYLDTDTSILDMARQLNERGVPVPHDWYRRSSKEMNRWNWDGVKGILSHLAYTGTTSIGHGRAKAKKTFNKAEYQERAGAWEAIIDRPTWEAVQERLERNREERKVTHARMVIIPFCSVCSLRLNKVPVKVCAKCSSINQEIRKRGRVKTYWCKDCNSRLPMSHPENCKRCGGTAVLEQPASRGATLSGFCYCGRCNHRLHKKERLTFFCKACGHCLARQRKPGCKRCGSPDRVKLPRIFYQCTQSQQHPGGCPQWCASEDELLPVVLAKLVETVDGKVIQALQARLEEGPISNTDILATQLEGLKKRYQTALDRIMDDDTPKALLPDMNQKAAALKAEVEEMEGRVQILRAKERRGSVERFVDWWQDIRPRLLMLGNDGTGGSLTPDDVPIEAPGPDGSWQPVGRFVYDQDGREGAVIFDQGQGQRIRFEKEDASPAPVLADGDKLRGLLRKLGCRVTLYWKPLNKRLFRLDEGLLSVELTLPGEEGSENVPGDCTSSSRR